ncbi:MAG: hybrid sensor histidine kinase/response regulator [Candidatus Desantisbacteria bacterium]
MKFDKSFFIAKFKEETDERLQRLDRDFVILEANPDNEAVIAEIFRDAHTLKGSAKMVGLFEINQIGHKMEDVLGKVKEKQIPFTPELSDVLFECLDNIRVLLDAEIKGQKATISIDNLLLRLEKAETGTLEKKEIPVITPPMAKVTVQAPASVVATELAHDNVATELIPAKQMLESPTPVHEEETDTSRERIQVEETIRVGIGKLDALLNLTSEMVINKIRFNHLLEIFKELKNLTITQLFFLDQAKERMASVEGRLFPEFVQIDKLGQQIKERANELFREYSGSTSRLSTVVSDLDHVVMDVRMLPVSTVFDTFPRLVRDISREANKEVSLDIRGGDTGLDKMILEEIKDPLLHLIRNCIDHGLETPQERVDAGKPRAGKIILSANHEAGRIVIRIEDDGRGIDPKNVKQSALYKKVITPQEAEKLSDKEALYLIFLPGFSTKEIITDVSGRGVGLDVVKKNVEKLKGTVIVQSDINKGTVFTLMLPLTLATIHAMIIRVGTEIFAIPTVTIEETVRVELHEIKTVVDKDVVIINNRHIPVVRLASVLDLKSVGTKKIVSDKLPIIILNVDETRIGFLVDELISEEEVVIKNMGDYLKNVPNTAGATILGEGEVVIILNVSELIKSAKTVKETHLLEDIKDEQHPTYSILVVDDAAVLRELEKNMLESAGYAIDLAVDGVDGFEKAKKKKYDLIVTDVEMPRMDGFELTRMLRADATYKDIPVVIVTAREKEEDKKRGIDVGADAYIVKTSFDQSKLLDTVEQLIG